MSAFDDLMQKYVNMEYDQLLAMAKESVRKILPICAQVDPDNKGFLMLTAIILSAVAADGVLSAKESRFLKDLLGLNDEQVDAYTGLYNGREDELTDKFADALSTDDKFDVVNIVSCIAACDETIKADEVKFIKKIMEQ